MNNKKITVYTAFLCEYMKNTIFFQAFGIQVYVDMYMTFIFTLMENIMCTSVLLVIVIRTEEQMN